MDKVKVIVNLAVVPPGYDTVQHPGSIIELEPEMAERYIKAGYACSEDGKQDLSKLKLGRMAEKVPDNG